MFQQLIAKASDDVKRKLEQERPDLVDQIQDSVTEITGLLQSKFGPASKRYFNAKRIVTGQYQYGNLNESSIQEYARTSKIEEVTVGLSLLCSLPGDVVERALVHDRDMILILAKALGFTWETAMSLLFLGAKGHRISSNDLNAKREGFARLNHETSRGVLKLYQSRKSSADSNSERRRLPQLHVAG
jgi:hypothetical protein